MNVATVLALCCAVAATAVSVMQGGVLSKRKASGAGLAGSRAVAGWRDLMSTGHRIGPATAALTIIEFGDFECPACAAYAQTLDTLRNRFPQDFAVVFHHYPLPYHRLAYPLARASECAAAQGHFVQFFDAVYAHPESLGVVPVSHLGAVAGVPDTLTFNRCFADTSRVSAIDADLKIARTLDVPGTPGIILDGKLLLGQSPGVADLDSLIHRRLAQRSY